MIVESKVDPCVWYMEEMVLLFYVDYCLRFNTFKDLVPWVAPMETGMRTATCTGIRILHTPDMKVIESNWGRVRWERDLRTGVIRRWCGRRDGGTGQEGQGGPA